MRDLERRRDEHHPMDVGAVLSHPGRDRSTSAQPRDDHRVAERVRHVHRMVAEVAQLLGGERAQRRDVARLLRVMRQPRYENVIAQLEQPLREREVLQRRISEPMEEDDHSRRAMPMRQEDGAAARSDDAVLVGLNRRDARDRGCEVRDRHRMGVQIPQPRRREGDEAEEENDGVPGDTDGHNGALVYKDTRQLRVVTLNGTARASWAADGKVSTAQRLVRCLTAAMFLSGATGCVLARPARSVVGNAPVTLGARTVLFPAGREARSVRGLPRVGLEPAPSYCCTVWGGTAQAC